MTARPGMPRWPLYLIASPAAVAVWSGWVGLGTLCGFGVVHPLPGIVDSFTINTAVTLPVGVEAYGAYALGAWLTPGTSDIARKFARWSATGNLALGMLGHAKDTDLDVNIVREKKLAWLGLPDEAIRLVTAISI